MTPKYRNITTCSWRTIFIFLCLLMIVAYMAYYEISDIFSCNTEEAAKLVRTHDGKYIQKIGRFYEVKRYDELSERCRYNDDETIFCPDIRLKGESLIRQIQLVQTRMLIIFDMICKKHNIKYWLSSGSLLGAVRDKVFVPWDNDIDVCMLREDYDKLSKIAKNTFPPDMMLQNRKSDPYYHVKQHNVAKLRDHKSCYGLCVRYGCKRHDGLMVDIFVLDKIHDKPITYESEYKRFKYEHDDIFPLTSVEFEGYTFSAPNKYEQILSKEYGDITKLPPSNKLCPSKGYIGHPWYSCQAIEQMNKSKQKDVIQESLITNNLILYYLVY